MSLLAEKMKQAGVDTIGAKLTQACIEALRRGPRNPVTAWLRAGELFGHEFVLGLIADMGPNGAPAKPLARTYEQQQIAAKLPYRPRVASPERLERRRNLQEIVRSKYKNSGGIAWSDVGWNELPLLQRDGKEAAALLAAGPAHVPNDGRTVGQVLGVKQIDQIIATVRS